MRVAGTRSPFALATDPPWLGAPRASAALQGGKASRHAETRRKVMPRSWSNGGKGGCRLSSKEKGGVFLVDCHSGSRVLHPEEPLYYNLRLLLTPFRPIDTDKHWSTRFYHRFSPLDEIARTGANTVNVHHATPINPWINYPFLRPRDPVEPGRGWLLVVAAPSQEAVSK